jgi:hypothetical protein
MFDTPIYKARRVSRFLGKRGDNARDITAELCLMSLGEPTATARHLGEAVGPGPNVMTFESTPL